ncbi:fimbrial protein [Dyella japonica]|uniref:Type 1 fimbria pilin n=1 Tax=Dyella japonica TaxID=231455 RepID=A0ABV2K3T4_9GAMM
MAVLLAGSMASGRASDLTIRFTGQFVTSTCAVSIPDIDLGTYPAAAFTGSYQTYWVWSTVAAPNCTPDITTIHMKFTGTPDSTNNQLFKVVPVAGQGNIAGVAIELSTGTARITPNGTIDWQLGVGSTSYPISARFSQTSAVTPGVTKTPITVQFTYN